MTYEVVLTTIVLGVLTVGGLRAGFKRWSVAREVFKRQTLRNAVHDTIYDYPETVRIYARSSDVSALSTLVSGVRSKLGTEYKAYDRREILITLQEVLLDLEELGVRVETNVTRSLLGNADVRQARTQDAARQANTQPVSPRIVAPREPRMRDPNPEVAPTQPVEPAITPQTRLQLVTKNE